MLSKPVEVENDPETQFTDTDELQPRSELPKMTKNALEKDSTAVGSKQSPQKAMPTSPPAGSKIEEQASKRVKISDLISAMKTLNSRPREK